MTSEPGLEDPQIALGQAQGPECNRGAQNDIR